MKTEVTEQERNAIESYANNHAGISDDKFANSAKKYDAYDLCDAVQKGAEFALSELRKPSNICPDCGYPKTTQGNGIAERICTCEPSESIGQTDEKLIQKVEEILRTEFRLIPGQYGYNECAIEIAKLLPYSPSGENGVNVKSALSELVSLQAFVLKNLISDSVSDYNFPDSTSRATIRNVMKIIHDGNERMRDRIRKSIRISNVENHSFEVSNMVVKNDMNVELLEALKIIRTQSENSIHYDKESIESLLNGLFDIHRISRDAISNAENHSVEPTDMVSKEEMFDFTVWYNKNKDKVIIENGFSLSFYNLTRKELYEQFKNRDK